MGVSTNGILVFGFAPEDGEEGWLEETLGLGDEENFEDFIENEAGVDAWREDMTREEKDAHYDAAKKAVNACPVDMVMHCSCDYPMYIVAIRGTEQTAHRGFPQEADVTPPTTDKIKAAQEWCEKYKIEWQEPKWILASLWC